MTHDVRYLAKRLFLQVFRRLVLSYAPIDLDEFERRLGFIEDRRDTPCTGCEGVAVEFEDRHGWMKMWVLSIAWIR
jgi:hypothetical protein